MKYTYRQLLEVQTELKHGQLWRFLEGEFLGKEARLDQAEQAAGMVVTDFATQNLRDRTLAKVAIYKELVELLPARLDTLIQEARELEQQRNENS
jgi:hypothetical protein